MSIVDGVVIVVVVATRHSVTAQKQANTAYSIQIKGIHAKTVYLFPSEMGSEYWNFIHFHLKCIWNCFSLGKKREKKGMYCNGSAQSMN